MSHFGFKRERFDLATHQASLADPVAGAYASFEGWVRNHNDGRAGVLYLEYEGYEQLGVKEGERIIAEALARFADARSAWRAHQVLIAWREDCAERLGRADVGPMEPVTVQVGTGEAYRTAAGKRAAGLGILRTGAYLSLVEVTTGAGHYPASWDPARVAVRRIARTF